MNPPASAATGARSAEVLSPLLRRCDVLAACEDLVRAGARQRELAEDAVADVDQLGLLTQASAELLEEQARAYAIWASRVREIDALLARELRGLAAALEHCAGTAGKARDSAEDLIASGDLEAPAADAAARR